MKAETVFVVWDELHENVVSVHRTEKGAANEAYATDEKGYLVTQYFEYDEFVLED